MASKRVLMGLYAPPRTYLEERIANSPYGDYKMFEILKKHVAAKRATLIHPGDLKECDG